MDRRKFVKHGLIGVGVTLASGGAVAEQLTKQLSNKPHISFPSMGNKVVATVLPSEVPCTIGMKAGDEFEVGLRKCGDFCGFYYSTIHKEIMAMQFADASALPEPKTFECPNPKKRVKLELKVVEA